MNQLQLHAFKGKDIAPYIERVSEFRVKYFKEFPHLYSGSLDYERKYMEGYSQEPQALLVVLEDESDNLLAFSTGMPLTSDSDVVKEACQTFKKAGYNPENIFYFGETIIVPSQRGKGYYSKIVSLREQEARNMSFNGACFMAVKREKDHPQRPNDYKEIDPIFKRKGYTKTPIEISFTYPTVLPDGNVREENHPMIYWVKNFN